MKKLMILGFSIALLAACSTGNTNEDTSQTDNLAQNEAVENTEENTAVENTTENAGEKAEETETAEKTTEKSALENPKVSLEEAIKIFQDAYPDVEIESIDLKSKSHLYYDIDAFDSTKEYELEIDAETSELIEKEVELDKSDEEPLDFSSIIDPAEALEIANAEEATKNLTPTSWSLDRDYAEQVYTVEYDDGHQEVEVEIHAETGEVLDVEIDD